MESSWSRCHLEPFWICLCCRLELFEPFWSRAVWSRFGAVCVAVCSCFGAVAVWELFGAAVICNRRRCRTTTSLSWESRRPWPLRSLPLCVCRLGWWPSMMLPARMSTGPVALHAAALRACRLGWWPSMMLHARMSTGPVALHACAHVDWALHHDAHTCIHLYQPIHVCIHLDARMSTGPRPPGSELLAQLLQTHVYIYSTSIA